MPKALTEAVGSLLSLLNWGNGGKPETNVGEEGGLGALKQLRSQPAENDAARLNRSSIKRASFPTLIRVF